eukprot:745224-Hanusia_phi.AAC.1
MPRVNNRVTYGEASQSTDSDDDEELEDYESVLLSYYRVAATGAVQGAALSESPGSGNLNRLLRTVARGPAAA